LANFYSFLWFPWDFWKVFFPGFFWIFLPFLLWGGFCKFIVGGKFAGFDFGHTWEGGESPPKIYGGNNIFMHPGDSLGKIGEQGYIGGQYFFEGDLIGKRDRGPIRGGESLKREYFLGGYHS